jgi:hypothetical protein
MFLATLKTGSDVDLQLPNHLNLSQRGVRAKNFVGASSVGIISQGRMPVKWQNWG